MMTTELKSPVEAAIEVLSKISKDSTWDDLMYHLYVREKIERGEAQIESGQFRDSEEVIAELLDEDDG